MSYFCDDCGALLGGYGHYGMPCTQELVPKRLAKQIASQTPFDLAIVTAAIIRAGEMTREKYDNRFFRGINWISHSEDIKRIALQLLGITASTNVRQEAGL